MLDKFKFNNYSGQSNIIMMELSIMMCTVHCDKLSNGLNDIDCDRKIHFFRQLAMRLKCSAYVFMQV